MGLTTGSGASVCLHITHGTPVWRPTAMSAAQPTYRDPSSPNEYWMFWYSFSICIIPSTPYYLLFNETKVSIKLNYW